MSRALELRGVRKRFVAGVSGCLASADVLRGIDLDVDSSESIAIVGRPGAGKSTLLLCAAGLLRPDSGGVSWFGESAPVGAALRTSYCFSVPDLATIDRNGEARVYFIDLPPTVGMSGALAEWIADRCESGSAVVVAARDERFVRSAVDRVFVLSGGGLIPARTIHSRVAESVSIERAPFC